MALCAGDWVEVRSKEEILRTLDKHGRLENMPFMPEMFAHCGRRIRVYKRAHKACDTLPTTGTLSRSLRNGVVLEGARCTGSAHGGCQAQCSIFWKEAWLKPAPDPSAPRAPHQADDMAASECSEADVQSASQADDTSTERPRYRCQATDFQLYTDELRTRNVSQYVEDWKSRNVSIKTMLQSFSYHGLKFLARPKWGDDGGTFVRLYDWYQRLRGGVPYPRRKGKVQPGSTQPMDELHLRPGELVRVKSYEFILTTIDANNMNRGMSFDGEMVPYCGGIFRVRARVERFVDERTGYMRLMKTPAVILDNVWCRSHYTPFRLFCPRSIYSWWREIWLERVPEATAPSVEGALGARNILKPIADEQKT
jgi:hypothetical protein